MLFKRSNRRRLEDMRCKVSILRTSMEARKKFALMRAVSYAKSKLDLIEIIERAYDNMIEELEAIENLE